ncbi:hypothetical protein COCON_G00000300 [Conger conger]|uniref:Uncharacterized protein n=1 Tax=Conger conger TaxID=82655 RepID=A0A9Q1I823_CONCO|nr:hypothetical protein COCON_G00000300 [Conger conger]
MPAMLEKGTGEISGKRRGRHSVNNPNNKVLQLMGIAATPGKTEARVRPAMMSTVLEGCVSGLSIKPVFRIMIQRWPRPVRSGRIWACWCGSPTRASLRPSWTSTSRSLRSDTATIWSRLWACCSGTSTTSRSLWRTCPTSRPSQTSGQWRTGCCSSRATASTGRPSIESSRWERPAPPSPATPCTP